MGRREKDRELARKRNRKVKLKKLRTRFAAAKNESEKTELREKARRISPLASLDE